MPTLRPFRDYDEKDVLNFFAYSGNVIDSNYLILANKGTICTITGIGFTPSVNEPIQMLGNFGSFSVNNFVAQRYGATAFVTAANPGTIPVGMTLFDVRELDENQLPLKYNPRKAAEMEIVLSGQVTPLVTRGTFLYSGIRVSGGVPVTAGAPAYLGYNGEIATSGSTVIGKFLGTTGAYSTGLFTASDQSAIALVWLNLQ
jgi:hypothetical protein